MWPPSRPTITLAILTTTIAVAGATALTRWDIAQRRSAFEADARIAHRLLSQRAAQHEAILATLVLLAPQEPAPHDAAQRLPALYPQLLQVQARTAATPWGDPALNDAEARSRQSTHAELARVDAALGRYTLVQAGLPASYALQVDVQRMVPWDEWPVARGGPVAVRLRHGEAELVLQPGADAAAQPFGLTQGFRFAKTLAAPGQPFELQLQRATGPADWPWGRIAAWCAVVLAAAVALVTWRRARQARELAEARLRMAQTARLSALGEVAAGIAHELNQPLAAMSAGTQAARRMLDDEPPAIDEARAALQAAHAQSRRAADVVARLRRRLEQPGEAAAVQALDLAAAARQAAELLEPERHARGVALRIEGRARPALAEPVALQQILHNLLNNALAALEAVPAAQREIVIELGGDGTAATLTVRDSGPGLTPEVRARAFEPFFTTRAGGLGLGLALCETLAGAMGARLELAPAGAGGACWVLHLPLAPAARASIGA